MWPVIRRILAVIAGFVAASVVHAVVLGVLLTLAGIANNLMLPPPAWFWAATLVVFLPATYVGGRLAPRKAVTEHGAPMPPS